MGGELNALYGFGPYRVDPENRLLLRSDRPVPLTPKAFDTLLLLVERSGRLVSKDELMKAVWPDAFVSDANLTQTIFMLRRALGDSASEQRFIVTVPGRGYRFAEAIHETCAVADAVTSVPVAAIRKRRWIWLIAAAVILLVQLTAIRFFVPIPAPKVLRFLPVAAPDRVESWQELVSDGTHLYFLERVGSSFRLMRTTASGGTEPVATPFQYTRIFSYSREQGAFLIGSFTSMDRGLPLWIWKPGETPARVGQTLADGAAWYPDGQIVYARGNDIRVTQRDGTGDRLFVHTSGATSFLRWSRDGKRLRFNVGDVVTGKLSIWETAADGSKLHPVFASVPAGESRCCGDWSTDGRYFIYTVLRAGKSDLWMQSEKSSLLRRAPAPTQITAAANSIYNGAPVGTDGRIYVFSDNIQVDSARYDPKTAEITPLVPGMQALGVAFSRDGKWITFVRLLDRSLWRSRPDGSEAVQLAGSPMRLAHAHWSPDGTSVAFEAWLPDQSARAYVVSASGGPPQAVTSMPGMQSLPVWSPDGKSVAVAMNVFAAPASALPRGIFIVNWATREATRLPGSEGLTSPQWSPDGKYLTAKPLDERRVLRFDSGRQTWIEIARESTFSNLTWSSDSQFLYFQDLSAPGEPLFRLRAPSFRREEVASFEPLLHNGLQRCIFSTLAPDGAPIVEVRRSGTRVYAADLELP